MHLVAEGDHLARGGCWGVPSGGMLASPGVRTGCFASWQGVGQGCLDGGSGVWYWPE